MNDVKQATNTEKAHATFMLISIRIINAIHKYETTQNAIIDALLMAHDNRLDPRIITPQQMRTQIEKIKDHLDDTLRVPEDYTHNTLRTLYQVMSVRAKIAGDKIIFRIILPLLHREQFQIFKLIPIPINNVNNETFIWIRPASNYLLATMTRNYFCALTDKEIDTCIVYGANQRICKHEQPLRQQQHDHWNAKSIYYNINHR